MNAALMMAILVGYVGLTWASGVAAASWFSGPINLPIPDADEIGVSHVVVVGENVELTDLTITVAIDHDWVGDLVLWLESPSGQVVTLMDRAGIPPSPNLGDSSDLRADYPIRFNDTFDTPADDAGHGCPGDFQVIGLDCTGDFRPEDSFLAAFAGESTAGAWTLTVSDMQIFDAGTLAFWSLDLTGSPIPLPGALWGLGSAVVALLGMRRAAKR